MGKAGGTRKIYDTYSSKNLHQNQRLKGHLTMYLSVFPLNLWQENENVKVKMRIHRVKCKTQKMYELFLPLVVSSRKWSLKLLFEDDSNIVDQISTQLKRTVIRIFIFKPKAMKTLPEIWNLWYMLTFVWSLVMRRLYKMSYMASVITTLIGDLKLKKLRICLFISNT